MYERKRGVSWVSIFKSEYYELPVKYNQTMIRLLVQSPTRIFAYWEVSDDTIKQFSQWHSNYSDCTPILKITNVTKHYSYMIPVDPYANNYYIEVDDPGCDYRVELGRRSKTEYVCLYTSNQATVPLGHPHTQDFDADTLLFANYLCIADKKHIKVFGSRQQYRHFANQNHTDFENTYLGSSEGMYLLQS